MNMTTRIKALHLLMTGLVIISAASQKSTHAQTTRDWRTVGGGAYGISGNWAPSPFPSPQDTARFSTTGNVNFPITFFVNRTAEAFQINDGPFSFEPGSDSEFVYSVNEGRILAPGELTLQQGTFDRNVDLMINEELNVKGDLAILGGTQVTSPLTIIDNQLTGGSANIFVTGTGLDGTESSQLNAGELKIGEDQSGNLIVNQGGKAFADSVRLGINRAHLANARGGGLEVNGVRADGTPSSLTTSSFMNIGELGRGTLEVRRGGFLSTPSASIATGPLSRSAVLVDGFDSATGTRTKWESGALNLGRQGFGEMFILSGGLVESSSAIVGDSGLGDIEIDGDDSNGNASTWDIASSLTVGRSGEGNVKLIAGGHLSTATASIASQSGSTGLVQISGRGPNAVSTWNNSGDVYVGGRQSAAGGDGTLEILADSRADITGTVKLWGPGTISLRDNGILAADTIEHTNGGNFDMQGGVLQVSQFDGNLLNDAGRLAPGPNAGSTLIIGDYTQRTDAFLSLDIGGTTPGGSHDVVTATGDALLDGTLELSLINGFTPDANDMFTVFSADAIAGFFDNIATGERLDTTDGIGSFVVNYGLGSAFDNSHIVLTDFEASLLGDFDLDGDVDADDIDFYSGNLGMSAVGDLAKLDLDADGMVTLADHDQHVTQLAQTSNGEVGALIGDINLDGRVDVLGDAFVLVGNLNSAGPYSYGLADLNADQRVDVLGDAFRLVGNLGQNNGSSSSAFKTAAVPEPNSLLLVIGASLLYSCRRSSPKL